MSIYETLAAKCPPHKVSFGSEEMTVPDCYATPPESEMVRLCTELQTAHTMAELHGAGIARIETSDFVIFQVGLFGAGSPLVMLRHEREQPLFGMLSDAWQTDLELPLVASLRYARTRAAMARENGVILALPTTRDVAKYLALGCAATLSRGLGDLSGPGYRELAAAVAAVEVDLRSSNGNRNEMREPARSNRCRSTLGYEGEMPEILTDENSALAQRARQQAKHGPKRQPITVVLPWAEDAGSRESLAKQADVCIRLAELEAQYLELTLQFATWRPTSDERAEMAGAEKFGDVDGMRAAITASLANSTYAMNLVKRPAAPIPPPDSETTGRALSIALDAPHHASELTAAHRHHLAAIDRQYLTPLVDYAANRHDPLLALQMSLIGEQFRTFHAVSAVTMACLRQVSVSAAECVRDFEKLYDLQLRQARDVHSAINGMIDRQRS